MPPRSDPQVGISVPDNVARWAQPVLGAVACDWKSEAGNSPAAAVSSAGCAAASRRIGSDGHEHVWRHTRRGDKYVIVIIDLTGIRDGTNPAGLLDMVEGRSKSAFKTWLTEWPQAWRDAVEVVAMDGFTGFKTAISEELPDAVAVMDPFHVVRLAGDALGQCRRRVQQDIHGHRGRAGDPLYGARRTLHTGIDLLTDKQTARSARCSGLTSTSRSRRPGGSTNA